jgi:hypothetical protein
MENGNSFLHSMKFREPKYEQTVVTQLADDGSLLQSDGIGSPISSRAMAPKTDIIL